MKTWIQTYIDAQRKALDSIQPELVEQFITLMRQAHEEDRQIFICGNGGNAANASHFATDLGKGASDVMAKGFRVLSINDNVSWMTALGNDYSYEEVFSRQLQNYARAGDLLITSSVSGNSPNVVRALQWAREKGVRTVALVGAKRGASADIADLVIAVDDTHYGRVEDVQMHILHIACYAFMEGPGSVERRGSKVEGER